MAVPGEQESFQSQSFSRPTPKRTTTSGVSDSRNRLTQERKETRQKYFSGRKDVPASRLDKRKIQADLVNQFKKDFTKPVLTDTGGTVKGVTQMKLDAPMSLSDFRQQTANKYGPTFREIGSDVRYGLGNIAQGFGDLAVSAMSGDTGLIGAVKTVGNFFLDQANKGYDDLNDVQKEIFDKQTNYKFAAQAAEIQAVERAKNSAIEAQNDALGLSTLAASGADATGISATRSGSGFNEQPSDLFGRGSLPKPNISIDTNASDPDLTQKQLNLAEGIGFLDPRYIEQQKALLDEMNLSPQVAELLEANQPGGKAQRELGLLDVINPFDGVPTGMALGEYISPEMYDIQKFKDTLPEGSTIPEIADMIVGGDDQASVTDYNNPGNLTDVGQRGTTGETYGNNFAVFPNARAGITALENDLALKVGRSNKVEDIIGQYASGDPNVGNYIDFVTSKVGPTVDQNELNDLRDAVIRFENKPDIAQQYLAMVAEGGLMDKKMYGGIISSK